MEFVTLSEKEFARVDFACGSFLQSAEMYRRYRGLGREAYLVGVKSGERTLAAGLVVARGWRFGKKIFRVPGGWLLDYDREHEEILTFLTRQAKEFCRKKDGMVLEISPNIVSWPRDAENRIVEGKDHLGVKRELESLGYKYLGERDQAKWVYVLELEGKTPGGLIMEFRTTHRQLIRKAEREGVRVRELAMDELEILKQITAESSERHGYHDPELAYYRSMKEYFGEKVKFVVAELPQEKLKVEDQGVAVEKNGYVALAASMFMMDKREIVYLYSGSVRRLQKYNGAYAIQWRMIQEAIKRGCERYNFYGVRPIKGNGVYAFKQGFRGHVEELLGSFALPIGILGKMYVARIKPQEYGEIE